MGLSELQARLDAENRLSSQNSSFKEQIKALEKRVDKLEKQIRFIERATSKKPGVIGL